MWAPPHLQAVDLAPHPDAVVEPRRSWRLIGSASSPTEYVGLRVVERLVAEVERGLAHTGTVCRIVVIDLRS